MELKEEENTLYINEKLNVLSLNEKINISCSNEEWKTGNEIIFKNKITLF